MIDFPYWRWEKAVPKEVCEAMINEVKVEDIQESCVISPEKNNKRDIEVRNNRATFMQSNHWFEGILWNHIRYANASMQLGYALDGCEPVQLSCYGPGEFYNWHKDAGFYAALNAPIRKMSAVCLLSNKEDFEGGELKLRIDKSETDNMLVDQGDLVVFPSSMDHKAFPVKKGMRFSAVLWAIGPAFK